MRVSGPESEALMRRLMLGCPEEIEPRHAYTGKVVRDNSDPKAEIIDEAVFLFMKGPASYTGEDMLEIQGHGSNVSLKAILSSVLDSGLANVRMADPGEFTKLAFLNGKMDLSQAEAVIDIIKAKTDLSLEIAEEQRAGRLGDTIREIRETLLDVLAEMAVDIDYPDEDYGDEENAYSHIINDLRWVDDDVEKLLDTVSIGRIAREGVRAVIVGKPNAGKSSLMNAILGEGRVIVTDVPGTTRDTVEESASLGGVPIVLIDTAGLRESDDKVEKIGIERTTKAIAGADILILVLDGSQDLDEEDEKVLEFIEKMNTDNMLVERMEERLSFKSLESEPGISRERLHLINAYRVNEERRDAYRVRELLRDIRSEVGCVLTIRGVLDIMDDRVMYFICTRRYVLEETTSSADGIKVLKLVAVLLYGLKDRRLSERSLVYHMRILGYLCRVMVDAHAHHFFFIFEYADLCGSSARIDY